MVTLFHDDCCLLVTVDSVRQLYERLARAGIQAEEWREKNHFTFNKSKNKIIQFNQLWKTGLKRRLTEDRSMG